MQFSSLNLTSAILASLDDEGYETPTPIQAKAIPPALEGRDVLGCAQTGTGKTAAFALPIIQHLDSQSEPAPRHNGRSNHKSRNGRHANRRPMRLPRALILSPTRELATQIGDAFATYGKNTRIFHTVIFGGVSQARQERALLRAPDVLVATPGRLIDLMEQGIIDLSEVTHFVLDEADRMLDMGFIQPIRQIAKTLTSKQQTLLFSATMPREIMKLADSLLTNPVKVAVTPVASAAPLIEQSVYMVPQAHKQSLLEHVLEEDDIRRALVFTRTKHGADKVAKRLAQAGISADAIHGNKSQSQRERALKAFRSGRARVLVATDVAARGIDVDAISHVFNYDIPNEPESYIHRIGRTGRAGATGLAVAFCDRAERGHLRAIENLTGKKVAIVDRPNSLRAAAPQNNNPHPHNPGHPHPNPDHTGRPNRKRNARPTHNSVSNTSRSGNGKRTRKADVPGHPSGPKRAATVSGSSTSRGPAKKASFNRGPNSQRTSRSRARRG